MEKPNINLAKKSLDLKAPSINLNKHTAKVVPKMKFKEEKYLEKISHKNENEEIF